MPRPSFDEQLNLADYFLFDRIAQGRGDHPALLFGQRQYTYAEVAARSEALARYLIDIGVAREQRVYVVLPDTPPFAWSIFGTLAAGAVLAMGNPIAPAEDLAHVVDYTRAAVVITTPAAASQLAGAFACAPELRAVLLVPDSETGADPETAVAVPAALTGQGYSVLALSEAIALGTSSATTRPRTHRDDVCVWLFTSGSTGRPKAAMHTHRDFAFNTEVYAKATIGYRPSDITVSVPRLFFGYATGTNLWFPFAVGATVGLYAERPTPESLCAAIAAYRPTMITNVPTMLGKLLDHDEALRASGQRGIDFSTVRFQLSAGEALPPALLERFTARFGGEIYDGIGSAEMFHIYATNRPGDIKPGSLGRAVAGYELKILPQEATAPGGEAVPTNEVGVLWVKGDSVALGYHQDRDKSWATFHGHWCRTGDLFRVDADGYVWFSGRADDLFKVGGVWVAPLEVEDCLMRHPDVALAAVIAVEEEGLSKPRAYVVLREHARGADHDVTARALQAWAREHLSKHKYPRTIVFLDEMPKNDRGKVDKKALREAAEQGEA